MRVARDNSSVDELVWVCVCVCLSNPRILYRIIEREALRGVLSKWYVLSDLIKT